MEQETPTIVPVVMSGLMTANPVWSAAESRVHSAESYLELLPELIVPESRFHRP